MWNLVAHETREGEVYNRLLEKLGQARDALGGRVFDVLGLLFEERPLRELLIDAIRYGDDPERREELDRVIGGAVDRTRLEELLAEKALVVQHLDAATVTEVRAEMERASARRLQPRFVQRFFADAFARLGGALHRREEGRFEITRVPGVVRERDRQLGTRDVVTPRYERICFDKAAVPGSPRATLVCPGHPLLDAVVDVITEQHGPVLKQGTILIDPDDSGDRAHLLLCLRDAVHDGRIGAAGEPLVISERLQFIALGPAGEVSPGGHAPHLDHRPATAEEAGLVGPLLDQPWLGDGLERRAKSYALQHLVPRHRQVAALGGTGAGASARQWRQDPSSGGRVGGAVPQIGGQDLLDRSRRDAELGEGQ